MASSSLLHDFGTQPMQVSTLLRKLIVDPVEPPSSPSDSLPSTTHSKSHHSDGASRHHRRYDRDRDHDFTSASARLLARLASRDDRDIKHARTLLVLTTERLESETRRADQAEQRVIDTLHRLRAAHEATSAARAETSRAHETIQMYKLQLDYAQREINRAQEILNQVEQERADAEAEAARARSTARRLREDTLITKAREQGRKEGYQEGLSVGRMVVMDGRSSPARGMGRRTPMRPTVSDVDEDDAVFDIDSIRPRSAPRRQPSSVFRISPPQSTHAPRPRLPPNFDPPRQRPLTPARPSSRSGATAQHAATLPVPTLITPMNLPSPSHAPSRPSPATATDPNVRRSRSHSRAEAPARSDPLDRVPTPIHNRPPSVSHAPYDILPDNYIPYANDTREITMPPPHELSRPVTPATPAASLPETILPIAAPSQETTVQPATASVRSRDFAYGSSRSVPNPSFVESLRPKGPHRTMSPQSRTSTRISEFDILGPSRVKGAGSRSIHSAMGSYDGGPSSSSLPMRAPSRSRTPGPPIERPPSPRGPRSHSDPSAPSTSSALRPELERRRTSSDNRGPLEKLFRKRYRNRTSPSPPDSVGETLSVARHVPDITVESPSTPASQSSEHTTNAPHLLSPDYANRPLPTPETTIHMRQEPEAPLHIPSSEILNVLPPGFIPVPPPASERNRRASGGLSRPTTPYAEAPLPTGLSYPDPPTTIGTETPSAIDELYGQRYSRATPGLGDIGGLSPLSIGKPLTAFSFANSDDGVDGVGDQDYHLRM
ncbi:hypothetical protein BXZ70DRAFT_910937 [Cristinia sonorae]|uniref:Uncharacterized protein n=1 Tax=Cristinia sonorae TaxID=1940300 RepID=A0A8K0UEB3_9AGAR|nr:hypothetical protein BXZ70DRAFT_910937 [Cristinia sonorae]